MFTREARPVNYALGEAVHACDENRGCSGTRRSVTAVVMHRDSKLTYRGRRQQMPKISTPAYPQRHR
jgi:hypothetical protein